MNDNNIVKYNSMKCDIIKYYKIGQPMPGPIGYETSIKLRKDAFLRIVTNFIL